MSPSPQLLPPVRLCVCMLWLCQPLQAAPPADSVDFFEQRIRPILVEHCYECHASESEQAGGLTLDSQGGWEIGGDSGPAIIPGDAEASRLFRAIASIDAELEMPPTGKLPNGVVEDFRRWVDAGAIDPRKDHGTPLPPPRGDSIDWEAGRRHWAYKPVQRVSPPRLDPAYSGGPWTNHPIDRFVLRGLQEHSLQPSEPADRATLLRRLSFDLTGLPPSPELLRTFIDAEHEPAAYEQIVDRLIASPDFSERFARHWLDVTRYAESVTLRGLVLSEAWRFRDYVIQSIGEDRSWKDVMLEHLAGDLLSIESIPARQRAQVAVTFLCLGNSNLEDQQKRALEMDFIDEQLDTIGRAMLGQTLGCARCHDHKFDPIPTSDYYALAGILHGSVGIDHANVSRWIENPLPLPPQEQQRFDRWSAELEHVTQQLAAIKKQLQGHETPEPKAVAATSLPGVVVDDESARRVGEWKESSHTKPFIDAGYIHDESEGRGEKSLTFQPEVLPPGLYDVRIAYCAEKNRSSRVSVTVFSADGEETVVINQRKPAAVDGLWQSLGKYRFERGGQAFVMLSNEGADGHVIGDAVHFLPLDEPAVTLASAVGGRATAQESAPPPEVRRLRQRQRELTAQQSELQKQLASRPQSMGLRPRSDAGDLPIHIRGSIHSLGSTAKRGVLRILAGEDEALEIAEGSCGRLEMARWIADDANPLTTRVLANRVWLWVMGQGLVRTPDNFGTTGQAPTHPELLDWLSDRLVQDGWSIKRLVKHIVMSATYRQSSELPDRDDPRWALDPDNRLWWRSERKFVSAEAIRDSVLAISGELDPTRFGSRIRAGTNADYEYQHDPHIRSIYMPVFRNSIPEILEAFNFTDPSFVTGQRGRGIVAQQGLLILNHPWFAQRAAAAARRNLLESAGDASTPVRDAFVQTLGRFPTHWELESATAFFDSSYQSFASSNSEPQSAHRRIDPAAQHALAELYHGLFATAEFRQLD